ncbi:MAG: hypothetical protein WC734_05355 [Patescibacteria group bacterium]|jgi:hypothetical protein
MIFGINIKILFAILSVVIAVAGAFVPYFRDIFRGKTKPHAYTWLIWTITQGTAVAGLWYGRGGWGALALTIGTVLVFVVFLVSLKRGTRNITKSDTVILIAALLAIVVWWQLHNPLAAVIMVSIIDVIGYFPSFRKTYQEPWTETPLSWVTFAMANILSMLALSEYSFLTLTYLIAITIANIILFAISLARRRFIPQ